MRKTAFRSFSLASFIRAALPKSDKTMKNIEDLSLGNIELAEQYLSGNMRLEEKLSFERRLRHDQELKEDLELTQTFLAKHLEKKYSPETNSLLQGYDFDQIRMDRKTRVGKDIILHGLGAILAALFMVVVCALIFLYIGKQ